MFNAFHYRESLIILFAISLFLRNDILGAGEIAQWLGTTVARAEELDLVLKPQGSS